MYLVPCCAKCVLSLFWVNRSSVACAKGPGAFNLLRLGIWVAWEIEAQSRQLRQDWPRHGRQRPRKWDRRQGPVHSWIRPCFWLRYPAVVGHSHLEDQFPPWLSAWHAISQKGGAVTTAPALTGQAWGEGTVACVLTSKKKMESPLVFHMSSMRGLSATPLQGKTDLLIFCFFWGCESGVRATILALSSLLI